jgi:hypothetical protein
MLYNLLPFRIKYIYEYYKAYIYHYLRSIAYQGDFGGTVDKNLLQYIGYVKRHGKGNVTWIEDDLFKVIDQRHIEVLTHTANWDSNFTTAIKYYKGHSPHREDGPAVTVYYTDGTIIEKWFLYGELIHHDEHEHILELIKSIRKNKNLAILHTKNKYYGVRNLCKEVMNGN